MLYHFNLNCILNNLIIHDNNIIGFHLLECRTFGKCFKVIIIKYCIRFVYIIVFHSTMVCYWCTCTIGYVVLLIDPDIPPYFVASFNDTNYCYSLLDLLTLLQFCINMFKFNTVMAFEYKICYVSNFLYTLTFCQIICTPFMCNIFAKYSHFNIILLDLYLVDMVLFDWLQMIYNNLYLVMTVILAVTYIVISNLFINRFYNMQNYNCATLNCILMSSHSDIVYKNMIMLLTTMLKRLNVSKIIPDDYNSIISKTPFYSCKHSVNPVYSTAFKFLKLIFEPVTIMPVSIAHNSVDTHYIDNSNTNATSTQVPIVFMVTNGVHSLLFDYLDMRNWEWLISLRYQFSALYFFVKTPRCIITPQTVPM